MFLLTLGVVGFEWQISYVVGSAWGGRMPELRSGVRQSRLRAKKVEDLDVQDPAANLVETAPTVAGRRGRGRGGRGGGRGAGRGRAGGRGRGVPVIDLDPDQPFEVLPGAAAVGGGVVGGPQRVEEAAGKVVKMDGGSPEKVGGGEDDASPVPEKVLARMDYASY